MQPSAFVSHYDRHDTSKKNADYPSTLSASPLHMLIFFFIITFLALFITIFQHRHIMLDPL